ncbi:MAG TPA: (Fe-S)-binding protein, partial [Dehalococcoidia bacterium]|nr:(Fe-S)-binding protein [Dehalococcoidia bacterium]
CGSGALYNVTQPESSAGLRARKLRNAEATGAEVIVTANPGCLIQLTSGLREIGSSLRVMHIADLLDQAYG